MNWHTGPDGKLCPYNDKGESLAGPYHVNPAAVRYQSPPPASSPVSRGDNGPSSGGGGAEGGCAIILLGAIIAVVVWLNPKGQQSSEPPNKEKEEIKITDSRFEGLPVTWKADVQFNRTVWEHQQGPRDCLRETVKALDSVATKLVKNAEAIEVSNKWSSHSMLRDSAVEHSNYEWSEACHEVLIALARAEVMLRLQEDPDCRPASRLTELLCYGSIGHLKRVTIERYKGAPTAWAYHLRSVDFAWEDDGATRRLLRMLLKDLVFLTAVRPLDPKMGEVHKRYLTLSESLASDGWRETHSLEGMKTSFETAHQELMVCEKLLRSEKARPEKTTAK